LTPHAAGDYTRVFQLNPCPKDPMTAQTTAARRLVEALLAHGVDHVFCVPGESYLALLDALADVRDRIKVIACRHEAGAANMAEAYGKLTGKPGIVMVTRGPGATHGSIGVHTAQQDSTPLIMFVGQVARDQKGRGAFQEVDYAAAFGPLAKWAAEIDDGERVSEFVGRAFATALQGRQGPVVLALPEDMLTEEVTGPAPTAQPVARAGLDPDTLAAIGARLTKAERPVMILGGSGWTQKSLDALSRWIGEIGLPTLLSFRRKDLIDNDHPSFAGDLGLGQNPKMAQRVKDADLLLSLGARLGENPTQGYTLLDPAKTAQTLIHIHPGPEELGRVWPTSLSAVADVAPAALALSTLKPGRDWKDQAQAAHADYEAFTAPIAVDAAVNLSEVVAHMTSVLPRDAIVCNGAGNFAAWLHRFDKRRLFRSQLAPTSGAMGYGFPAAIAAKIVAPEREVVCFAGDGDFLMTAQEMATAVQYGAAVVTVVVDNGAYGTIRMHQERDYPGRVIATDLKNPDFAAYAKAFGAWATTVERTEDFPAAFDAARKSGKPALIHLKTDVEHIAPGRTLTQLRAGRR
jgi:acetolactate synthase-1/2/3 large subunit